MSNAPAVDIDVPATFWVSQPLNPGETALVSSGNMGTASQDIVNVIRVDDNNPGASPVAPVLSPIANPMSIATLPSTVALASLSASSPSLITPLYSSSEGIQFTIPSSWSPGVFAYTITNPDVNGANPVLINAPDIWFIQGDQGSQASAGGWLVTLRQGCVTEFI